MKFSTRHVTYRQRLKKGFLLTFLFLTSIILYIHFKNSLTWGITAILISSTGLVIALSAHLSAKTYFHEVEIKDNSLVLRGDSTHKPLTVELPISETDIYPKSKGYGRGNVEYFIRFKYDNKTYDINQLFNWNYATLLELFHKFKEQKNEKIISDEKHLLEFIEKKSKGLSSYEIFLNKDKKNDPTT